MMFPTWWYCSHSVSMEKLSYIGLELFLVDFLAIKHNAIYVGLNLEDVSQ